MRSRDSTASLAPRAAGHESPGASPRLHPSRCLPQVLLELGGLKLELPLQRDPRGFITWQYLDDDLRISTGNKGSMFIHVRE